MDFFSGLWNWAKGSSIAGSLAKTALLVYASRLLAGNTDPSNSSGTTSEPDPGVRLQLAPSTENQIPVLYGEAYFGGNITDAILSTNYKKIIYCLTLAETTGIKLSDGIGVGFIFKGVYLDGNRVVFKADGFTVDYTLDASGNQDISYRDLIKIYFYANGPLQPQTYTGTTPSAYTVMSDASLPSARRWVSPNYPMTDLMFALVEVNYNKDKNVTGLPDCKFHVDTNMKKPGDVLVDYMINTTYGAGIDVTTLDSSFTDLNNYADAGFTYTSTTSQSVNSPITINGLIDTSLPVLDNMKKLAEAANCWISYDTTYGLWRVVINQAGSSIATFTDSNMIGDISISGTSLTQLNSAANVRYQNTDILDEKDFVKIEIPAGDLYENEFGKTVEINLDYTNSQVVAAKVGLVQLKQGRVDKIIQFKSDYSYIDLKAGDLISVTTSVYGFTSKVFRIISIAESFDDDGILSMDITALEYDADVYTYNITEYEVETDGGILGIGSIGKPNTPTVTKTEQSNVPKIVVNGVVPSGVVDVLEFWITFDTTVSEQSRNYIKIGQYTDPSGATLTQGVTYTFTYTGLQQSDFYVKIRGANSITVGPYSDPSGLIAYVPIVVADTISDNPVSIGGQLMSLGLLTLLNNLDGIFKGLSGTGSLFDKIFSAFEDKTGVDLVGQASGGSLVVASSLAVSDEGNQLTATASSMNFVGNGVTVTNAGTAVTVTINGTADGGGGGGGGGTGGAGGSCFVSVSYLYPPDKSTNTESYPENSLQAQSFTSQTISADKAPISGYYAVAYTGGVYSALIINTGSIKLYKSDGTLVETKQAADCTISNNVIRIPFSTRTRGTDYYIIMDQGIAKTLSGCLTAGITDPKVWNFNTPWTDVTPYNVIGALEAQPGETCPGISYSSFGVRSYFTGAEILTKASRQTDIRIIFTSPLVFGSSGTAKLYTAAGSLVQTFNAVDTASLSIKSELMWISGSTLYIDPTVDLTPGTTYYVTLDSGVVRDACGNANSGISSTSTIRFTVDPGPTATASIAASNSIDQAGLSLTYDRPITYGTGSLKIYDSSNNLVASVPATDASVSYTTV